MIAVLAAAANLTAVAATNEIVPAASIDPVFEPGLVALMKATGIIESTSNRSSLQWAPNLQLLIGVKAVDGVSQTVRFVELTTLPLLLTNSAGKPLTQRLHTNHFDWSGTNKSSPRQTFEFVSAHYPVRIRVFDPAGRKLKEGKTDIPWELLTNSLAVTCRVCLPSEPGGKSAKPPDSVEFVRPFIAGMISLITVFGTIQSSPALSDVCEKARCAVRLPSLWSMASAAVGASLVVSFEPRFGEISLADPGTSGRSPACYRLPVDMKNNKRILTTLEIIVGPPGGADVLLGGMRSIRAIHPTKKDHVFSAQILATGVAREESGEATSTAE